MGREKATVMVCDNPRCEKVSLTSDDEPALGFYFGEGAWHGGGGGGPLPELYACSQGCILRAVTAAMEGDR